MQLQHEEVGDRADAQDHHAQDVDRVHVLGVDRAPARSSGREEQVAVALGDDGALWFTDLVAEIPSAALAGLVANAVVSVIDVRSFRMFVMSYSIGSVIR